MNVPLPAHNVAAASWIKNDVLSIPGWSPEDQLQALFSLTLASSHLPGDILEVGSWCGRSAVVLAAAAIRSGNSLLRCIDPFPQKNDWYQNADGSYSMRVRVDDQVIGGYQDQTVWKEPFERDIAPLYEKNESIRSIFDASVDRFGCGERVRAFRGTVAMFAGAAEAVAFRCRLAFVDGDHGYDAVRADIDLITRWLVPGGWICFDDAFTGYVGVDRALEAAIVGNPAFDIKQQITRKMFVARRRAEPFD